ncbi:MAG: helix-turn-helix domain-containing protein [Clostridia bacterium]|nr:helix-turn-helix domain-containing protein [Clostridia bacterium]
MTQEQLAAELFVSRDLVSKWETDKSPPNYKMILKMAELFSVEVEVLFDKDRILTEELAACVPADKAVGAKELKEAVNGFLSSLSVRDRAVFIRRYYFFEDASEIGAEYGIGEGYVRTILMRARKKLKNYMKGAF